MTNFKEVAKTLAESREFLTDDSITPQLIADAIGAIPQMSIDDARMIVKAIRDSFPGLDEWDIDLG